MSYAMKSAGKWMFNIAMKFESGALNTVNSNINIGELKELALTSAGLKAFITYLAANGIEDCRKCCIDFLKFISNIFLLKINNF
jgi:hypothetical protein